MANNRMYLRCRTCGQALFMGKTFGGAYGTENFYYQEEPHTLMQTMSGDMGKDNAFLDKYNEFLGKHCYCMEEIIPENEWGYLEPSFKPKDVSPENNFEIAYEFWYG